MCHTYGHVSDGPHLRSLNYINIGLAVLVVFDAVVDHGSGIVGLPGRGFRDTTQTTLPLTVPRLARIWPSCRPGGRVRTFACKLPIGGKICYSCTRARYGDQYMGYEVNSLFFEIQKP